MENRKIKQYTPEEKVQYVMAYKNGTLKQAHFCEKYQIPLSTFGRWLKKDSETSKTVHSSWASVSVKEVSGQFVMKQEGNSLSASHAPIRIQTEHVTIIIENEIHEKLLACILNCVKMPCSIS